jgi:hypothetical protein
MDLIPDVKYMLSNIEYSHTDNLNTRNNIQYASTLQTLLTHLCAITESFKNINCKTTIFSKLQYENEKYEWLLKNSIVNGDSIYQGYKIYMQLTKSYDYLRDTDCMHANLNSFCSESLSLDIENITFLDEIVVHCDNILQILNYTDICQILEFNVITNTTINNTINDTTHDLSYLIALYIDIQCYIWKLKLNIRLIL